MYNGDGRERSLSLLLTREITTCVDPWGLKRSKSLLQCLIHPIRGAPSDIEVALSL